MCEAPHQEDEDSDDDAGYDYEKCLGSQTSVVSVGISADVTSRGWFCCALLSGTMYSIRQMHCTCVLYLGVII